ncbi:MAG: HAMP domain-containing histidine kinase [Lachnospiraceae bacterium]|nr:HAMP domain-containing histidine kinase [Lachnospiraceae bacterium]
MKKPRLKKYIFCSCLIAFILSVIICIVALYVLDRNNFATRSFLISDYESDIVGEVNKQLAYSDPNEVVKEGLKSDKYGLGLADVNRTIKMVSAAGCFSALYDNKGRLITDASQAVFFRIYKKNENGTMKKIWLESDYNKIWKEIFEKYHSSCEEPIGENDIGYSKDETINNIMDNDTENVQVDTKIVPEEIYYKGGYFVPGKIHVRVKVVVLKGDDFITYSKDVFDIDMTPDNVSEYTKLSLGNEQNGYFYDSETFTVVLGISKDTKDYEDYEYFTNYLKNEKTAMSELLRQDYSYGSAFLKYNMDSSFMHHIECSGEAIDVNLDDNDFEYAVVAVGNSDILTDYESESQFGKGKYNIFRKVWLPIGLFTSFIMMIIASVIGGFVYIKKKSAYDMYCYRIETTNAMAHDLKTPLTAISGYAENLVEQVHVDKREYYAKSIISNVDYMNKMIHDILELSKSEDARCEIYLEEVALVEIVNAELDSLSGIVCERGLTVSVLGDCVLSTDRNMITSLVDNLISNAVRYAKEQTNILIVLADKKTVDAPFISKGMLVKNTLSSPLQKSVEELKKPYVKGDDSRGSRSGSGVGLTIVENVAKKLKCKVVYNVTDEEFSVKVLF